MGCGECDSTPGKNVAKLDHLYVPDSHIQIFQPSDAPRYRKGFTAHFCLYVLYNLILLVTRCIFFMRNKKRRQALGGTGDADNNIVHTRAFLDLTDRENEDFRVRISYLTRYNSSYLQANYTVCHLGYIYSLAIFLAYNIETPDRIILKGVLFMSRRE